jgi:hypothetical protein
LKIAAARALCALAASLPLFALSPSDYAPDTPEPGSIEAIAAATTEPRFLSPWVAYVPESASVPSPGDFLGHIAGAPGELSRTAQVYGYFRALDAASPRVHVEVIGKSEEGRDILLAAVADEAGIADLARLREATALLADPRRCDQACMESALPRSRTIYYLNGGLHSTETGSPEMLMELAYRLAVSERPEIRAIRERLIVLMNPVSEPDGRDRTVDWYYRFVKGKTDYDNLPETSPPYWGKYVFHDNNRDTHQRGLALTRAIQDMFLRWHPQVMHDLHESVPFLLVWTGTDPQNIHMDPIVIAERMQMSFQEVRALSSLGMPGAWTWGFGDAWAHLYVDSVALHHNAVARGYETFGIGTADTMDVRLDLRGEEYLDRPVTRRNWYRPWPPPRQFRWSLRNNTNYMQTGVLSILQYSSLHAPEILRDFYNKGKRAVARGAAEPPYAFAIPERQDDRGRLATLINLLRAHGIEVSRARTAFQAEEKAGGAAGGPAEAGATAGDKEPTGREFAAGTFVVRLDQPYRGYAIDLLEPQDYPAGEADQEPYDDVSWSLPVHFGVQVTRLDDPRVRQVALDLVTTPVKYAGRVDGQGPAFLMRDSGQEALLAARHRLSRLRVEAAEEPFKHGGAEYPAGSWLLPVQKGLREALESAATELGLDFESARELPAVRRHALELPRFAVFAAWEDTQAAGWVRMLFDQMRIAYTYISDDDIKRGGLDGRFDVILYPHTNLSLARLVQGIDPRHGPMPYTQTKEYPTHGLPLASPDITGGLTHRGVANLAEFVERGGVLITLGGASAIPIEGGFVRYMRRARTENLSTPGVEIRARFSRADHPIAYGYPRVTSVMREDFPLYETREADLGRVVLQWGLEPLRYYDKKTKGDGDWAEGAREVRDAEEALKRERKRDSEQAAAEHGAGGAAPNGSGASGEAEADGEADGDDESLVVSGGGKGVEGLEGKPAILDLPLGRGRVVAFNFDPIHRLMTRSDFRLVWNAILNWNDFPPTPANPPGAASRIQRKELAGAPSSP